VTRRSVIRMDNYRMRAGSKRQAKFARLYHTKSTSQLCFEAWCAGPGAAYSLARSGVH
jgi:hypothetical protein